MASARRRQYPEEAIGRQYTGVPAGAAFTTLPGAEVPMTPSLSPGPTPTFMAPPPVGGAPLAVGTRPTPPPQHGLGSTTLSPPPSAGITSGSIAPGTTVPTSRYPVAPSIPVSGFPPATSAPVPVTMAGPPPISPPGVGLGNTPMAPTAPAPVPPRGMSLPTTPLPPLAPPGGPPLGISPSGTASGPPTQGPPAFASSTQPPPPPTSAGTLESQYQMHAVTQQMGAFSLQTHPPLGGVSGFTASAQPAQQPFVVARPFPEAQCPDKYMRMSITAAPSTQQLATKAVLPWGCVIHPLAKPENEQEKVPLINFGTIGIIRCRRCRGYINPFVQFLEGGRRWRCNLCDLPNDVPTEYYSPLDGYGRRVDTQERPELSRGCVEFIAPSEYMVRPPQPPAYFFCIDVSYAAVSTGVVETATRAIRGCLDRLPGDVRTRVGILTYDTTLHFYSLKPSQSQPHMLVVTELDNPFPPVPDDLLVPLRESRKLLDVLLDKLPGMFRTTQVVDSALGPALKAAFHITKAIGGKTLVFQSAPPSGLGGAPPTRREDATLLGTDKEALLLKPAHDYFKNHALECSRVQVSVDVFAFGSPSHAFDLGSLAPLAQLTGGELFYYPNYTRARHAAKFEKDVERDLLRETGFEAVMRIRVSKGLKVSAHHGNFFIRSADLLALPNVDADKTFAVQLQLTDNLSNERYMSLQAALLYTTSGGERRIRVMTQSLPFTASLADLYKFVDEEAMVNLISKMAVDRSLSTKLSDAREAILNACIDILSTYKQNFSTTATVAAGSLVLPETLKLLPLYTLAMLKCQAFRGGREVRPDDRVADMARIKTLSVPLVIAYLYPRLFNLATMPPEAGLPGPDGRTVLPPVCTLSSEVLDRRGAFLLENGHELLLWVGRAASPALLEALFGVASLDMLRDLSDLPPVNHEYSQRVRAVVQALRAQRPQFLALEILVEGDPLGDARFFSHLVEDRTKMLPSYNEFLVQLQRQIMGTR